MYYSNNLINRPWQQMRQHPAVHIVVVAEIIGDVTSEVLEVPCEGDIFDCQPERD